MTSVVLESMRINKIGTPPLERSRESNVKRMKREQKSKVPYSTEGKTTKNETEKTGNGCFGQFTFKTEYCNAMDGV